MLCTLNKYSMHNKRELLYQQSNSNATNGSHSIFPNNHDFPFNTAGFRHHDLEDNISKILKTYFTGMAVDRQCYKGKPEFQKHTI